MSEKKINVLDHGYVRLVDYMGSDLSVVRSARVSYDAEWRSGEDEGKDVKLINYLWKNKHTTPFESVVFTFEVKAPIFVVRQWHRHRTWSFNEVSARYTELPGEYYLPDVDKIGTQSKDNKQVRDLHVTTDDPRAMRLSMETWCDGAFKVYLDLLRNGCPRELARCVLPLGTYTRMFASVDLLNLLKFIQLRDHPHAQYEIAEYARAMLKLIEPIVPVCVKVFKDNG